MDDSDREYVDLALLAASDDPAEVDLAHEQAVLLMGKMPHAKLVMAMAYDRTRAFAGRAQKFGTQSVMTAGQLVLWPVDPGTTDSERAKWFVKTLAELHACAGSATEVTKAHLRRLLRRRRAALQSEQLATFAERIADHGCSAIELGDAAVVAAYWPLPGEADPRLLAQRFAKLHGARLALPVVDGDNMSFREWLDDDSLQPAGFGTLGPKPDAAELQPTIVLAPLVGFDRTGARLGQGKGYYDRKLAAVEGRAPLVVGIACSCQEVPVVPTELHDRRLDVLLTEVEAVTFDAPRS
ncbi:MAG: 5-formyltetrahydrofolate cyclo-ligase [Planctomycetota bacterium]|jgi:5-formyltetrahydrofolate cyclo-ligase